MLKEISFQSRKLSVRLIASFVTVMVVTLLAVGVPLFWLIRGELEQQAEARLTQGANSTQAIYAARLQQVQALVDLAAERPTLRTLTEQRNLATLPSYLEGIRGAPRLDFLVLFDSSDNILSHAQLPSGWDGALAQTLIKSRGASPLLSSIPAAKASSVAIQARAPVSDNNGAVIGTVVGGLVVDDKFVQALREETGLDHNIFSDGTEVAGSLPTLPQRADQINSGLSSFGNEPFYVQKLVLESDPNSIVDVLASPAGNILATETLVLQVLFGSVVAVTLLVAVLGYVLARRVTAPLRKLNAASEGIGRGDLNTPVNSPNGVVEIMMLARTLERMRFRLRTAYDDLERSKTWSENLIASLAEGVMTVDASGRITSFSPGAERMLGWRATDVIGRSIRSVFHAEIEGSGDELPPAHTPPGSVVRQAVSTREGHQVILLITSGAVTRRDDGSAEQALVLHDVTEEEEALRLREFFLANVSHELKTPLSSLRASVELLAAELTSLTHEEQVELVNSLWLGTIRLEELVDNLLSSASIRSGQFEVHMRPTDLESVVEEAMLTTRPLLILRGQHLKLDIPSSLPLAWADRRRLSQVLINLISNASKYGPPKQAITVRVQPRQQQLIVQVADKGHGISPDVQPLLFQPFKRSDDSARGGVGLGLSIVKTIIERHGGEVGVKSGPDRGSTFWFSLRIADQASATLDSTFSHSVA